MKPDAIDFLLSRLTWPSVMVRERTATEVARLVVSSDEGDQIKTRLLEWIERQRLESVVAIGLLVLLRAETLAPTFEQPSQRDLDRAIGKPSLLSWMLCALIRGSTPDMNAVTAPHLEAAPASFKIDSFFTEYVESFLPPIYAKYADKVQQRTGLPFRQQWAYEWKALVDELGITPSRAALDFWMTHLPERFAMMDSRMSDVYRSAYLRTLAWALSTRILPISDALYFTIQTCPVDFGLWRVEPGARPTWWPTAEKPRGEIDTVPIEIWRQVEALWEHQATILGDVVVGHAYGTVCEGDATYLLEVGAMLQTCQGPAAPSAEDVAAWYFNDNRAQLELPSPLVFGGTICKNSLRQSITPFADWEVAPLTSAALPETVPRWQSWRFYQNGVWLPSSFLSNDRLAFSCTQDGVEVSGGAASVGQWRDWIWALRERGAYPPPKNCGNYTLLNRRRLEEVAAQTSASYCWVCRLTAYYQKHRYEHDFQEIQSSRLFGGSSIIRS